MNAEQVADARSKASNDGQSRGKWSRPTDFIFVFVAHAFRADTILYMPVMVFRYLGFYAVIPYLLIVAACVFPIAFIQSYLGQFSGTGFISAFRISPLFKGLGYVSLVLNVVTLACYSIFCAIPLILICYVLRQTIPWSCEGIVGRMGPFHAGIHCEPDGSRSSRHIDEFLVPSMGFIKDKISLTIDFREPGFSYAVSMCITLTWTVAVLIAMRPIEAVGRFAKYTCGVVIVTMCLLLLRFLYLPGALDGIMQFLKPAKVAHVELWFALVFTALSTLGPGWGSIITMASFNDFKANVYKFTWIASFVQLAIMLGVSFMAMLMAGFLYNPFVDDLMYDLFLIIPTGLTLLEIPHFWSLIFFGMLFMGSLNLLVIQLVSVLTALFDEYESLRANKRRVTMALGAALAVSSFYFCSNQGHGLLILLSKATAVTQMLLNLLLLLVVLWVCGRERFQRDVLFMTSRVYSSLAVNLNRFVSPLFLLIGILVGLSSTAHHIFRNFTYAVFISLIALAAIPWLLVPFCCIYKVMRTTGASRFSKCLRPTDWYPADPLHRQQYEEACGTSDESRQPMAPLPSRELA